MSIKRIFLIVFDSFGIGALPDAKDYQDSGTNTLKSIFSSEQFSAPTLQKLGLFEIDGVEVGEKIHAPIGCYGRMAEVSAGKDTTIGHWEIAGIYSPKKLPVYPNGFPKEIIEAFEKQTNRHVICNLPYSGTKVLQDYGQQHLDTGDLIVYTSADSVFQIAAHEKIVPVEELYRYCEIARQILQGEHAVGRVIARPFIGEVGTFQRTANRHDFSLKPPSKTMLDILSEHGLDTIGIGKIFDIFAGQGIQKTIRTKNNQDGMNQTIALLQKDFHGICFVNLVDFDMLYGHRNDIDGYAHAIAQADKQLKQLIEQMEKDDLLIITADHGCDPGYLKSTDHSREYTPLLVYGKQIRQGVNLATRKTFSDIAKSILDIFQINADICGTSFWNQIK